MKSLKDVPSVTQVKEDTLLGITRQPPNTCPIINLLIFNSERSSGVFEVDIKVNPEDLYLDLNDLKDTVAQLHQWAIDVSNLYDNVDRTLVSEEQLEELDEYYNDIEDRLRHHYLEEVEHQAKNINKIIKEWEDLHTIYIEEEKEIEEETEKKKEFESDLADLDTDDDDYIDNKYDLKDKIERSDNDIYQLEKSLSKTNTKFDNYVEAGFKEITDEFSDSLEILRTNNDQMRQSTYTLKKSIIPFIKENFNLMQPMCYLKKLEKGHDNEISLGVLDRMSDYRAFSYVANYLFQNNIITQVQRDVFSKINDVDTFVDMVHGLGYKTVRYYKKEDHYIQHPEVYCEKNIKNNKENNYKNIVKI